MKRPSIAAAASAVTGLVALGLSFGNVFGGDQACSEGTCREVSQLRDTFAAFSGDASLLPGTDRSAVTRLLDSLHDHSAWQVGVLGWAAVVVALLGVVAVLVRRPLAAVVLAGGGFVGVAVQQLLHRSVHLTLARQSGDIVFTGATVWTWLLLLALAAQAALAALTALSLPPVVRRERTADPGPGSYEVVELEVEPS